MAFGGRTLSSFVSVIAAVALATGSLIFATAPVAQADDSLPSPPPLLQRDENVVTSDPLPTVQINDGYVWAQAVIGTTVYAVGQFKDARPALTAPGTSLQPRSNILAFDINSGDLLPFAPTVNGSIKAIAASPDGSRIYIGGSFNTVNGETRWNFAALDARTGELVPGFAPSVGGAGVYALAADADAVYVGGLFTQANGTARQNLAAFTTSNGALRLDWDSRPDQQVDAMVLDPDGQHVIVGGRFSNVDGDGTWRGLASIDSSTGQVDSAWQGTQKVKNGWGSGSERGKSGIFGLNRDGNAIYGTGWVFASAQVGNLEGVFSLEPTSGETRWVADCLGDHYGIYSTGDVVYSTSHTHACSTMNLAPEQSPRSYRYVEAMTTDVRGTLPRQPHTGTTYANWQGENAPSAYVWYPDFFTGKASGLGQAGLSITGAGNVISVAGEFPGVNNRFFQGIVRFSTTPPGGAKDGPRTTTAAWGAPTASNAVPGRIGLSIKGTWDRDDRDLTYELTREGTSEVIASATYSNGWWNVPTVTLVDSTVEAGATYTYRITVKDGDGNSVASQPVTATANTGAALALTTAVLDDGASLYYPLGDSNADWAGANPPVFGNAVQAAQPSEVLESSTGYSRFNGTTNSRVSTSTQAAAPTEFSTELWFNTTTTRGGKLIGYGNAQTGSSSSYDRQIYMLNDGRLRFGVYPDQAKVVTSTTRYNDGSWHHAVATLSSEGMKLYVDGVLVGSDSSATGGQPFNGYWRIGGDNLANWPDKPSSNWFNGSIDEVAVYPHALSDAQISTHYAIGTGYEVPTASFTLTANDSTIDVDGSASTVAAGGSLVDFTWDFGDGSDPVSGTSATATHSYAQSGTYNVTLTVRDDRGLVATTTRSVSVLGPNVLPAPSFAWMAQGLALTVDGSGSTDPDGTIETYTWDWGDGSEPGTGTLASHTYALPGNYNVTLTVTDDRDGSADTTQQVEVTHAAPMATFEATASALTVETDATGSTASDGATLTYSWDWGDGSEASTGEQSSHTYAADGTYEITLTATDSLGASTEVTRTISVQATVYAAFDEFERVVSNGWGEAPTGGLWTARLGSASAASTNGSEGILELAPGQTRQMALQSLSLQDLSAELVYRMNHGPAIGTSYVGVVVRQSATSDYTVHAWHRNNGEVWLAAQQGATVIGAQQIPGVTWAQGDEFVIKTEVTGSYPTTIRAKLWRQGTPEPEQWQLTASNSAEGVQQAGFASVRFYQSGSATATGSVAFDRVSILDLGEPASNTPPVAEFTSSISDLSVAVDAAASSDADGAIASYEWDWGDGSATDSGVTSSHQYASAGDYTITLTVTDDHAASHSVTKQVAVSEPASNTPPVAEFTSSISDLSVAVDAAASSDADGAIASYEWDWGDGSATDSGVTSSHQYASAGDYTITLTVTDDKGASSTKTGQVTVQETTPSDYLIRDDFERNASASWGSADIGGSWTITGGSADASVADGSGQFLLPPNQTRVALLPESPLQEYMMELEFSIDAVPQTGYTYVGAIARDTEEGTYIVQAWLRSDGTIWLVAQLDSTLLKFEILPDLVYQEGDSFTLKLEATGTTSTQLRAKLWKTAEAEPENWQLTAQDSTAGLQTAGSLGVRVYRSGSATSPAEVTFDRFYVTVVH